MCWLACRPDVVHGRPGPVTADVRQQHAGQCLEDHHGTSDIITIGRLSAVRHLHCVILFVEVLFEFCSINSQLPKTCKTVITALLLKAVLSVRPSVCHTRFRTHSSRYSVGQTTSAAVTTTTPVAAGKAVAATSQHTHLDGRSS